MYGSVIVEQWFSFSGLYHMESKCDEIERSSDLLANRLLDLEQSTDVSKHLTVQVFSLEEMLTKNMPAAKTKRLPSKHTHKTKFQTTVFGTLFSKIIFNYDQQSGGKIREYTEDASSATSEQARRDVRVTCDTSTAHRWSLWLVRENSEDISRD